MLEIWKREIGKKKFSLKKVTEDEAVKRRRRPAVMRENEREAT